jgi:Zn-dependent protease with chaperone function
MDTNPKVGERFFVTLREVGRLRLYLVTLALELLTAGLVRRWFGRKIWLVIGLVHHMPFSPQFVGWACMLGPLLWSLSAFWLPGSGSWWCWRVGAFNPSRREARKLDLAFEAIGDHATKRLRRLVIYVVDTEDRFVFIRGITLIVSRGLIESDDLVPALSHELGHACTTDGRLMLALDRLALFGDPLAGNRDEDARREEGPGAAGILAALRWGLRIAGGTFTLRLLWPAWANYLRKRERAADAYSVALGYGPGLAHHLENWKQPTDRPHRRLLRLFNMQNHDRVAYRLDILLEEPPRPGESEATGFNAYWKRACEWLESIVEKPRPMDPKALFEPARGMVETVFANARVSDAAAIDAQAWVLAAAFAEHPVQLTTSQLTTRVQAVAEDATLPVEDAIRNLALAHAIDIDGEDDTVSLTVAAVALREHALL